MMNKKELRLKYKELRQNLSTAAIDEMSLAIANQLLNMNIWDKTYFHLFLPITKQNEVNTEYVLQILHGKDKEIIISKSDFETLDLHHYLLTDNTKIKENNHGIPEPLNGLVVSVETIEVVFVPLLAYDKSGNRVGYGKGFYDKFLSQCRPETIKIGLSFFESEDIIFDVSKNDVKLDFCVTSQTVLKF